MAESHTLADDIVYDLVSIQYHALKGSHVYARFAADAEGHDDVLAFIGQVRQEEPDDEDRHTGEDRRAGT